MQTLSLSGNNNNNIKTLSLTDNYEDYKDKEEHKTLSLESSQGNIDTVKNEGSINYFDLDNISKEYGRALTKEDIIK